MDQVLNIILAGVSIIVTGLASWGVAVFTNWINSKMKDKKMAALLAQAMQIVADAVKLIFQEFGEEKKKNGKFDEATQKEAKEAATKIIMNKLTPELKEFITTNYGDISAWVNEQIEVAIYNFKNSSK